MEWNPETDELPQDSILLFDGNSGIYIPQRFAQEINRECVENVTEEQWAILESGPDNEHYWDTWNDVENNAILNDPKLGKMYLYQDGDVWAIPEDCNLIEYTE